MIRFILLYKGGDIMKSEYGQLQTEIEIEVVEIEEEVDLLICCCGCNDEWDC